MKTALITGGSAGIGKITSKALAAKGYKVIIVARDKTKGESLVSSINNDYPNAKAEFHSVDISMFEDVRRFAEEIRSREEKIDLLILNAGLYTPKLKLSESGHEYMFATTHLGNFLLTHELMGLVKNAENARIVVTSSVAHHMGSLIDFFETLEGSPRKASLINGFATYGRSKLANLLFIRELAERLKGEGVLVNAFHPGGVKTEIWRDTSSLMNSLINPFLITEEKGADTQIFLATDPSVTETGKYWCRRKPDVSSKKSKDKKLIRDLWEYSEKALGIKKFGVLDVAS